MSGPSRRAVLAALGWGTAGITALALGGCGLPALPPRNESTPDDAAAWISLRPEGHFELYSPRVEMGQGIAIGLRQLAAEELGVGVERVVCIQPDTAKLPVCRATVGSDSMRQYGPLVARAAAALALAMREHAAERLGVGTDTVSLGDDGARAPGGLALSLPELGQTGTIVVGARELDGAAPRSLAKGANRHTAGQPLATDAVRAVVTGEVALYADDIRLPGMLFGAMLRSDGLGGSISQIDDSACQDVPGYAGLVRGDGYAGVLAERRGALTEVLRRIRATDTYDPTVSDEMVARAIDVDAALADGGLEHTPVSRGAVGDANFDIDLRLDVPSAAHASIEPRTAVARFGDDGELEVWSGTQDAFFVRKTLATELGLAEERVRVHGMRIGGGFGARTLVMAELEAARLAHHSGRPVKVQWSRRDEFRAGFHRQPSSHRIRATADADGRITRWWHAFRAGHVIFTSAAMGPTLQFATSFVADPGTARGAIPPYAAPAVRVEFEDVRLPVHTGPWRGLGAGPNCWAIETAIDALARRHGRDPVEFRLANIADDQRRLAGALRRAADMAGWQDAMASDGSTALGVACGIYKEMSYAAAVARVERSADGYRVTGLWCAHDCGLVINPDQVRAQVEGNLVWGIGMALGERLEIGGGRIIGDSFFDYGMPRHAEVPDIEVALIDNGEAPSGAGETAMVCGAAAVTNAIARLSGTQVAQLPVQA